MDKEKALHGSTGRERRQVLTDGKTVAEAISGRVSRQGAMTINKDNVFGALEPSVPETKIQPTSSQACADKRAAILLAKEVESAWPSRSV